MAPRSPPSGARLALGFLVAPLAVPLLDAAVALGLGHGGASLSARGLVAEAIDSIVSWTTPLSYGFALAVGIPVALTLRRAGRLTIPWLVAASAAGGAALSLAPIALLLAGGISCIGEEECRSPWLVVGLAALLAAAVALAFCAVAGVPLRRRPADALDGGRGR